MPRQFVKYFVTFTLSNNRFPIKKSWRILWISRA